MESEIGMRTDIFEKWWKEESVNLPGLPIFKEAAWKIWQASWKLNAEKIIIPRLI